MATVVPPPSKRQKREFAEKSRAQQDDDALGIIPEQSKFIRTRFRNAVTQEPEFEHQINIPVEDLNPHKLNLMFNSLLQRERSEYEAYRFTLHLDDETINVAPDSPTVIYNKIKGDGSDVVGSAIIDVNKEQVFQVQVPTRSAFAISGHGKPIVAAQFSPSTSSKLVTGSGDHTAKVWDCETGTPVHTLKGHTDDVLVVSWSHDESKIATGGREGAVRLWDSKTGAAIGKPMLGHRKFIRSMSWEPFHLQQTGIPRLASASHDTTVRIWLANQQKVDMVLSGHTGSVTAVRWGACGLIYTSSKDRTIRVWNANNGTLAHALKNHTGPVNHLSLSTDFITRTSYHDHTGKSPETEVEKQAKAKDLFEKASTVKGEVIERLVSASDDCTLYLWEPLKNTSKPIARMQGHAKGINQVMFSPDGRWVASAGLDNQVKIWDAQTGVFKATLRAHVAAVYQCCFSSDSKWLATASKDSTVKVWSMSSFTMIKDLPGHEGAVYALDWSPFGQRIASGGQDKQVRIWRR